MTVMCIQLVHVLLQALAQARRTVSCIYLAVTPLLSCYAPVIYAIPVINHCEYINCHSIAEMILDCCLKY